MWRRTACFVLMWLSPLSLWVTVGCFQHRQSIDSFGGSDIRKTFGHQKCTESFCKCLKEFTQHSCYSNVAQRQASVWLDKIWDTSLRTCWVRTALFIKHWWTLLAFGNMLIFPVLIPNITDLFLLFAAINQWLLVYLYLSHTLSWDKNKVF